MSLGDEKPQSITIDKQNTLVGPGPCVGAHAHPAYSQPGKYQFIYLLPVLIKELCRFKW